MSLSRRVVRDLRRDGLRATASKGLSFIKFQPPVVHVYTRYYRWKVAQASDYEHLADPFTLRWLDPLRVKKMSPFEGSAYSNYLGRIMPGKWDMRAEEIKEYDIYYSILEHFNCGVPWEDTDYYKRVRSIVEEGESKFGCRTINDVDERFQDIDLLYTAIRDDGYIPSRELSEETNVISGGVRGNYTGKLIDEIVVDIDRNGEPLFVEGRHRLAIAASLELDQIPVLVARRHDQWQSKRENLARRSQSRDIEHFDLVDIR